MASEGRRIKIRKDFDFDCGCIVCPFLSLGREVSNKRYGRIQDLDKAIGNSYRMVNDLVGSLTNC